MESFGFQVLGCQLSDLNIKSENSGTKLLVHSLPCTDNRHAWNPIEVSIQEVASNENQNVTW